jgi:hypothetical protein
MLKGYCCDQLLLVEGLNIFLKWLKCLDLGGMILLQVMLVLFILFVIIRIIVELQDCQTCDRKDDVGNYVRVNYYMHSSSKFV